MSFLPLIMKYEALLTGLRAPTELDAQYLRAFSNSQLVVGQVRGDYEARKENIKKYLQKVKDLMSSFSSFDFR